MPHVPNHHASMQPRHAPGTCNPESIHKSAQQGRQQGSAHPPAQTQQHEAPSTQPWEHMQQPFSQLPAQQQWHPLQQSTARSPLPESVPAQPPPKQQVTHAQLASNVTSHHHNSSTRPPHDQPLGRPTKKLKAPGSASQPFIAEPNPTVPAAQPQLQMPISPTYESSAENGLLKGLADIAAAVTLSAPDSAVPLHPGPLALSALPNPSQPSPAHDGLPAPDLSMLDDPAPLLPYAQQQQLKNLPPSTCNGLVGTRPVPNDEHAAPAMTPSDFHVAGAHGPEKGDRHMLLDVMHAGKFKPRPLLPTVCTCKVDCCLKSLP